MSKLKVIIIDDEENAREALSKILNGFVSYVEVIGSYEDVPTAVLGIKKLKPDLVFLDIEMPRFNGFELLNFFSEVDFEIIFATAYHEHAIKAFNVSAVDYLLKPLDIEKVVHAVEKVRAKLDLTSMQRRLDTLKANLKNDTINKIALPMSDGLLFIDLSDIIQIQAEGAYSNVVLQQGNTILVSKRLKYFQDMLENVGYFYRIHKSTIINVQYISKYIRQSGQVILHNNNEAKVARERKSEFEESLSEIRI